jgi:hypothetical protein
MELHEIYSRIINEQVSGYQVSHSEDGKVITVVPNEHTEGEMKGDAISTPASAYHPDTDKRIKELNENKDSNKVYQWANEYTKRHLGKEMPKTHSENPPSSLAKQHAIGVAYHLAASEHPEYQRRVFEAYKSQRPDIIKETGATDYHSLLKATYNKVSEQTEKQFNHIPLKQEYREDIGYTNSKQMLKDVHLHNHITVYRGGQHETMNVPDEKLKLTTNEKFRTVHDVFGHGIHGNEFGPVGEEVAWHTHSQMYTPAAQAAMSAETRGQNSYVNYLHHNIDAQEQMKELRSQKAKISSTGGSTHDIDNKLKQIGNNWNYAPNKSVLLPPEMISHNYTGEMPSYLHDLVKNNPDKPSLNDLRRVAIYHNSKGNGIQDVVGAQNDFNRMKKLHGYE